MSDPARGTDRWYLSAAPIGRALVHLCVPMAAGISVTAVYNVINAGFVGSRHDPSLLAALTFGLPLLGLVMAVGGVFGVGGSAEVSRLLGAAERDPAAADRVEHVTAFAVWGAVLAGAAVAVLGVLLRHPLVALLGADDASRAATTAYVTVLVVFVPVLASTFCLEQLVRAQGAARQSMVGLIASVVANLVLDVVFILVLGWGVAGAALAVGLSNVVAAGYYAWFLQRHGAGTSLSPRRFTVRADVVRPVLGIGVGELLQSAFLVVTTLVFNNLAIAYGDGALAAFGVAVRIAQVPEFLVMGLTLGVLPLLAYSYGKGDAARLGAALRGAALAVGGLVVVLSGLVFALRDQVFGIFSDDAAVVRLGVVVLTAQLVATLVNGFTGLTTSLFQAAGRVRAAIVMSVAQGVLFVPVVLGADAWFGLTGLAWSMTVTEVLVLGTGLALWVANRRGIAEGLAAGSEERAEAALEPA